MENKTYTTRQVAKMLGLSASALLQRIYNERVREPQKSKGRFVWTGADIRNARIDIGVLSECEEESKL